MNAFLMTALQNCTACSLTNDKSYLEIIIVCQECFISLQKNHATACSKRAQKSRRDSQPLNQNRFKKICTRNTPLNVIPHNLVHQKNDRTRSQKEEEDRTLHQTRVSPPIPTSAIQAQLVSSTTKQMQFTRHNHLSNNSLIVQILHFCRLLRWSTMEQCHSSCSALSPS